MKGDIIVDCTDIEVDNFDETDEFVERYKSILKFTQNSQNNNSQF